VSEIDRAKHIVVARESMGAVFLAFEPVSGNPKLLGDGQMFLDLVEGTTYDQAMALAGQMNELVQGLAFLPGSMGD
jgi:hypothetical protein